MGARPARRGDRRGTSPRCTESTEQGLGRTCPVRGCWSPGSGRGAWLTPGEPALCPAHSPHQQHHHGAGGGWRDAEPPTRTPASGAGV